MVTIQRITHLLYHPVEALRVINRSVRWRSFVNDDGTYVLDQDWDNLIILDACRYDIFAEEVTQSGLTGDLQKMESRAPTTSDWVRTNFQNRTLDDIVCVSNNPWYEQLSNLDLDFHAYHPSYSRRIGDFEEALNDLLTVIEGATNTYQNKRLLIHVGLPHEPYIGPTAQEYPILKRSDSPAEAISEVDHKYPGEILEKAYRENLRIGLEVAEKLYEQLSGKTVISSDHGELLGERYLTMPFKQYGHHGILVPELLNVPWFVCEYDNRKEVHPEDSVKSVDETPKEELEEHLEHLGYQV
jgi:hypothetical protein